MNDLPKGRRLAIDATARSASSTEPAFIARPDGTPLYYGFVVLDDVNVDALDKSLANQELNGNVKLDPEFDNLRSDSRYAELLRRVRIAPMKVMTSDRARRATASPLFPNGAP
jgi:hypothetical protein